MAYITVDTEEIAIVMNKAIKILRDQGLIDLHKVIREAIPSFIKANPSLRENYNPQLRPLLESCLSELQELGKIEVFGSDKNAPFPNQFKRKVALEKLTEIYVSRESEFLTYQLKKFVSDDDREAFKILFHLIKNGIMQGVRPGADIPGVNLSRLAREHFLDILAAKGFVTAPGNEGGVPYIVKKEGVTNVVGAVMNFLHENIPASEPFNIGAKFEAVFEGNVRHNNRLDLTIKEWVDCGEFRHVVAPAGFQEGLWLERRVSIPNSKKETDQAGSNLSSKTNNSSDNNLDMEVKKNETQSTKRVFVSHARKDSKIAEPFVEHILKGCLSLNDTEIFYSSGGPITGIGIGKNWRADIRDNIIGCEVILFLVTKNFNRRPYCLAEQGAAWGLKKEHVYHICVPPSIVKDKELFGENQFAKINDKYAMHHLVQNLVTILELDTNRHPLAIIAKGVDKLLEAYNEYQKGVEQESKKQRETQKP